MKKLLCTLIIVLSSCSSNSNKSESHFNSHQEILDTFTSIISDANITSQSKSNGLQYTAYQLIEGENKVDLSISETNFRSREVFGDDSEVKSLEYRGEFEIMTNSGETLKGKIRFHLPEDQLVTPENIIEYNKYDGDFYGEDYLEVRQPYGANKSSNFSYLKKKYSVLNNNGHMLIMDDFISLDTGDIYNPEIINLRDIIKDTIAYGKIVNGEYDGRYYNRNVVKINGEFIKYYVEEGRYKNGNLIEYTRRNNLVVGEYKRNIINENNNNTLPSQRIVYSENNFYLNSEVGVIEWVRFNESGGSLSFIWNDIKDNIEVDEKGYHSYKPLIKEKTTYNYEYSKNDYYESDDFDFIKSYKSYTSKNPVSWRTLKKDENDKLVYDYTYYLAEPKESFSPKSWDIQNKYRLISLKEKDLLDGEYFSSDEYLESYFVNAKFESGTLLSLDVKTYEEDWDCDDSSCYFLKSVSKFSENKIVTKKFDEKGEQIGDDDYFTLTDNSNYDLGSFDTVISRSRGY